MGHRVKGLSSINEHVYNHLFVQYNIVVSTHEITTIRAVLNLTYNYPPSSNLVLYNKQFLFTCLLVCMQERHVILTQYMLGIVKSNSIGTVDLCSNSLPIIDHAVSVALIMHA